MPELHFAVASTFSPRFLPVLAEADRVAKKFGARLSVLHSGERSDKKVETFRETLGDMGREEVDIYWCEGATPAEALLDAAGSEYFDLLIAGALDKSGNLRNFTGSIARELLLRAPCDLLLLPNPELEAREKQTACLMVESYQPRWRASCTTLAALAPSAISVLAAESPFARAREAALGREGDDSDMRALCDELEKIAGEVDLRTVQSNTGFALCDIVQDAAPDFLIVEAEWKDLRRVLPPHLDWLNQVIPARLFLLGKPPTEASRSIS